MPLATLKDLLSLEFKDDEEEIPKDFNSELEFWDIEYANHCDNFGDEELAKTEWHLPITAPECTKV